MKIGVILEAGAEPRRVAELAKLAESCGIETLWSSAFAARRDPTLGLALASQQTAKIRLGYMPVSSFEIEPMKIADTLLTLNELSEGRASILLGGLGKSSMMAMGLEPKRRVTATKESIEIVKAASAGGFISVSGELYKAQGDYSWAKAAAPKVYVAANKELMLRLAGSHGDGVMLSDIVEPHMADVLSTIDEGKARRAKPASDYAVNNFWAWHVKEDKATAIREARQELVWRGALQRWHMEPFLSDDECTLVEKNWDCFLQAFIQKTDEIQNVPDEIVEKLLENLTLCGDLSDIDRIIDKLKGLERAGQNEIALRLHADPEEAIRLIGSHIVPAFS